MKIKIVLWDAIRDQTVVYHDDVEVWSDHIAHIDQYLRFYAPVCETVTLEIV